MFEQWAWVRESISAAEDQVGMIKILEVSGSNLKLVDGRDANKTKIIS